MESIIFSRSLCILLTFWVPTGMLFPSKENIEGINFSWFWIGIILTLPLIKAPLKELVVPKSISFGFFKNSFFI